MYKKIANYYTEKLQEHGPTPQGVDWKNEASQLLRFEQLYKIISSDNFTLNELGCGYGKFFEFLEDKKLTFQYRGYDLSEAMVNQARKLYAHTEFVKLNQLEDLLPSDYSIASGIFNVKMDYSEIEWLAYIIETLIALNRSSNSGFAFNILTKYSDPDYMRSDLYYADPLYFFDYCKQHFSRNVALLHDYDLYEFTILVRKI